MEIDKDVSNETNSYAIGGELVWARSFPRVK
jgi:hypothetical protein